MIYDINEIDPGSAGVAPWLLRVAIGAATLWALWSIAGLGTIGTERQGRSIWGLLGASLLALVSLRMMEAL